MIQPEKQDLWRQYEIHVDLYKAYLQAAITLNSWYYAITGAIISFCFSKTEVALLKWSLLLPLFLSAGLAVLFFLSAWLLETTRNEIFLLSNKLGMQVAPEFRVFGYLLCIFGCIAFLVGIILFWFLFLRESPMTLKTIFSLSYVLVILGSLGMIVFATKFPFSTRIKDLVSSEVRLLGLNGYRLWQVSWLLIILGTGLQLVNYWVN